MFAFWNVWQITNCPLRMKRAADVSDAEPLNVKPKDLGLSQVKSNAGGACPVQLIPVPVGLRHIARAVHRSAGIRPDYKGYAIRPLLKIDAVVRAKETNPLDKVGFCSAHDERLHTQQPLTGLVWEDAERLSNGVLIRRLWSHSKQLMTGSYLYDVVPPVPVT